MFPRASAALGGNLSEGGPRKLLINISQKTGNPVYEPVIRISSTREGEIDFQALPYSDRGHPS